MHACMGLAHPACRMLPNSAVVACGGGGRIPGSCGTGRAIKILHAAPGCPTSATLVLPRTPPQMERRDRLRQLLAHMGEEAAVAALGPPTEEEMAEAEAAVAVPASEIFYTEGSDALRAAREELAQFSLRRAALRLAAARRAQSDPDESPAAVAAEAERQLRTLANQASELGDERPIVGCAFSPDGSQLATGAWSGTVKVWAMPSMAKQLTIKAHAERVTGIAWHPEASSTGGLGGLGSTSSCRS